MRQIPLVMIFLFVTVTSWRSGSLLAYGYGFGWLGWAMAIGLAVAVVASGYAIASKTARRAGWWSLGVCLAFDVWYNTLEVLRTTSSQQLIVPGSDFIGLGQEQLRYLMQIGGLGVALFPTLIGALSAWVYADLAKDQSLIRRELMPKLTARLLRWLDAIAPAQQQHVYASETVTSAATSRNEPHAFSGKRAEKTLRTCECGCGLQFTGRADKHYLNAAHKMRHYRAQGRA